MGQEQVMEFKILCDLIMKGGVYSDVEGSCVDEIFEALCQRAQMPSNVEAGFLKAELSEREKILSTGVGHGVAIPHPRKSILSDEKDQRIIVCYPKTPVDMFSPDGLKVSVMFVLLTKSTQIHFGCLANLAKLVHSVEFRHFIETKPDAKGLSDKILELESAGLLV